MKIGDKIKSRLYENKGIGTIIGFSELFGEHYTEILFKDGNTISIKTDDLVIEEDPIALLQNARLDDPSIFFARQMLLRLQANISENAVITSTNYRIQPLPHQLLTVNFVMNRFQPRSLIADEVGLGKTIEAILVYQEFKLRGIAKKILIVVPSGLVLQWHEELVDKFNEKFVIYTKDYIRALKQSYGEEINVWKLHDKIIASIDSIKPLKIDESLDKEELNRREWHNKYIFEAITDAGFDIVIIDEAHKLSKHGDGRESARFKLGEKLSETIPILLLLTATPHQGDEHLFLNLLRLIDPILFTSLKSLTPALVQEVAVRNKKRAVVDFDGNRIFKHRITSLIEINRARTDNKEEIELYEFVTEYTAKYYNLAKRNNNQILMLLVMLYQRIVSSSSFALLDAMKKRKAFLEYETQKIEQQKNDSSDEEEYEIDELLKKSTFTNKEDIEIEKSFVTSCISLAEKLSTSYKDIKFRKLIKIIEEVKNREQESDLKCLIFTEFRATQNALIQFLNKFGYSCSFINGSLSREEKVEQVELFRTTNQILVSTDAGGEGINLQFCYFLINYDLPWNPSRLEQRIGRIDRIGQTHNALVFNFHLTDTIEDRVRKILEIKLEKIKMQFGDDKYADIITLLQEEFSFDRIYFDAIRIKEVENKQLDQIADQIYKRAKEILDKDELLLPFSQLTEDPQNLVNVNLNSILKHLVTNYLSFKGIEVKSYKDEGEYCYFTNPFHDDDNGTATYRNVTFENLASTKKENIEFVNIEHPLVKKINTDIENNSRLGTVSTLRININKFQNISGYWFIYKLFTSNQIDKHKTSLITVFMEDEEFNNSRVSNYLEKNIVDDVGIVQNYVCQHDLQSISNTALKYAEEKANEIFTAVKLTWLNEINQYEQKYEDYLRFKRNAFSKIQIDNIRESKLKALEKDRQEQLDKSKLKRNIVPKMELYQLAYAEFI